LVEPQIVIENREELIRKRYEKVFPGFLVYYLRVWVGITPCPLENLAGCFHITLVTSLEHLDGGCYHFIIG
jgi:hypothetical protein